jgi:glycerol-3-phosphate acyltransferase PlsY
MEKNLIFIILIIFSYFCASTPFGYLIAKTKRIDIRKTGSGNVGATNILRTLGFGYFLLVAILDIAKIALPIIIAQYFGLSDIQISIIALVAIVGNMFSFWLKFKGGKAVSAIFGVLLCLIGLYQFLLFLFIWALLLFTTKIMSLSNILIVMLFPFVLYHATGSLAYTILGIIFIPIIWISHRENIKRLSHGKEPKIINF